MNREKMPHTEIVRIAKLHIRNGETSREITIVPEYFRDIGKARAELKELGFTLIEHGKN